VPGGGGAVEVERPHARRGADLVAAEGRPGQRRRACGPPSGASGSWDELFWLKQTIRLGQLNSDEAIHG
jgi:hypothetical protein